MLEIVDIKKGPGSCGAFFICRQVIRRKTDPPRRANRKKNAAQFGRLAFFLRSAAGGDFGEIVTFCPHPLFKFPLKDHTGLPIIAHRRKGQDELGAAGGRFSGEFFFFRFRSSDVFAIPDRPDLPPRRAGPCARALWRPCLCVLFLCLFCGGVGCVVVVVVFGFVCFWCWLCWWWFWCLVFVCVFCWVL